GAEERHVQLRERGECGGHRVEGSDLGVVGGTEANVGDGTGHAPQFPSKAASNWVFLRGARLRPYNRAQNAVIMATKSCIKSSWPSSTSLTITNSRSCDLSSVWIYATPKRAQRSWCSTTIWLMLVSASRARNRGRWSFTPEPHSFTT